MHLSITGNNAYAYTAGQDFCADKPTLVFIHGAAHDHSVWALQSRYFAHHGRNVLALDLPAHGRSEGPPLATIEAMADWCMQLVDAVGAQQVSLIGHSMGSLIALHAAALYPRRVTRIALLGTAYPMRVSAELLAAARDDEPLAWRMLNVWSHHHAAQVGGNPNPGMWLLGRNLRLMQRCPPGVTCSDLTACNDYSGGEAAAAALRCPTLMLLGRRDVMTAAKIALAFGKTLSNARTHLIDTAGHSMTTETPDAVLDALIDFLD